MLREQDFADVTKRLLDIADRRCRGRVVSFLEGGYDIEALAALGGRPRGGPYGRLSALGSLRK